MSGSEVVLPIWLSSVRNRLKESSSWRELCSSVFDATKSECSRNNVAYLSDVSVGAKGLIMDAVEKRLEEDTSYRRFVQDMQEALDVEMQEQVSRMESSSDTDNTYVEQMLSLCGEGSAAILRRWPEMKSRLQVCIAQVVLNVSYYRVTFATTGCSQHPPSSSIAASVMGYNVIKSRFSGKVQGCCDGSTGGRNQ